MELALLISGKISLSRYGQLDRLWKCAVERGLLEKIECVSVMVLMVDGIKHPYSSCREFEKKKRICEEPEFDHLKGRRKERN
jgi:hypothetical protein